MSRLVILSPHADDAVWSLGGMLRAAAARQEVLIATLFNAGQPALADTLISQRPSERWRLTPTPAIRRREDERATAMLGCRSVTLPFVDAALRCRPMGFDYRDLPALFEDVYDDSLLESAHSEITELLEPRDRVLAPMALGGHVDHRLTRDIALGLPHETGFYEEFPYAGALTLAEIERATLQIGDDLTMKCIPGQFGEWSDAAAMYRSQVLRLFGSRASFDAALTDHAYRSGIVPSCRIWAKASMNFATEPSADNR